MPLNKSKGNMYDFVTHTWNTIKGECPHKCTYCYMHKWGKQKQVVFDGKELRTDLGKDNFIFVGSSCDMFAYEISDFWINETLDYCRKFDNSYLFQSKNPFKMLGFLERMPIKSVLCTTIETNRYYPEIMNNCPVPFDRANALSGLFFKTYVTIEPIMDFDLNEMVDLLKYVMPEQVNIGADSGGNKLPEPPKEKLLELIDELKKFTVINKKSNLGRLLK